MYDTAYDGVAGYLVDNPINRYLINSTTEGLVFGDDGSLTIAIQRDEPQTPEARANWLPAPDGRFYLVLRMYWPEDAVLGHGQIILSNQHGSIKTHLNLMSHKMVFTT